MRARSLLISGLLATAPAALVAQSPWYVGVGGGASAPMASFSDAASVGWHALAVIGVSTLMQPLGLRLDAQYNRFNAKSVGPDQAITSATLNVTYRLPSAGAPIAPYLIAGAGGYHSQCVGAFTCGSATRFGWNAGLGTKLVLLGLKPFVEARFHSIDAEGGSIRYLPVTFGLTF